MNQFLPTFRFLFTFRWCFAFFSRHFKPPEHNRTELITAIYIRELIKMIVIIFYMCLNWNKFDNTSLDKYVIALRPQIGRDILIRKSFIDL